MEIECEESSRKVIQMTTYRPSMAPRETVIHRTSHGTATGYEFNDKLSYGYNRALVAYRGAGLGKQIQELTELREKEKKDMQQLNERFAYYISQVKFYAAQQKSVEETIEVLKRRKGGESKKIEALFVATFGDVQELMENTKTDLYEFKVKSQKQEKENIALQEKLEQASIDCDEQKEKYQKQCSTVIDLEAEIASQGHRLVLLQLDREQNKKDYSRMTDAVNRAKMDLSKEELFCIQFKNRRLTLEVDLENMRHDHDEKINALTDTAFSDTTYENQRLWEGETGQRLRDIQQEYEIKFSELRDQYETTYSLQIQEFTTASRRQQMETWHAREEVKRFKIILTTVNVKLANVDAKNAQIRSERISLDKEYTSKKEEWEDTNLQLRKEEAKLMPEREAILKECEMLKNSNPSLEKQITEYRNLLEGTRDNDGLHQMAERLGEQKSVLFYDARQSSAREIILGAKTAPPRLEVEPIFTDRKTNETLHK